MTPSLEGLIFTSTVMDAEKERATSYTSVKVQPAELEILRRQADRNFRSMSAQVSWLIRRYEQEAGCDG
jgi:hypothetical protein